MAGQPQKRAIIAALEKRTRETFEDDADATHLDYVEHWQASGQTLNALAEEIGLGPKKGETISRYLHRVYGGDVTSGRLTRARARGAHSLIEDSLEIADEATEDDIQIARLRVQARQWTAEKWNQAEFSNKASMSVQVSFGALHLAALQKLQLPVAVIAADDAELVDAPIGNRALASVSDDSSST